MALESPETTTGGRRSYTVFWILLLLIIGTVAWFMFWPRDRGPEDLFDGTSRTVPSVGSRQVTLYFADPGVGSLVSEGREVGFGASLEENVEMTISALVQGPEQEGSSPVLPRATRLIQAFFADQGATLYLDFNTAMMTQHPGGSAAEYATLSAIVRTLGANFQAVRYVQILVDGQPIDSLAGHFDTSRPLEIVNWQ